MDELIRAVLTELAKGSDKDVVKDISIVSNGVRRDATGKWFVTWRHPDRYGSFCLFTLPFSPSGQPQPCLIQRHERAGSILTSPLTVDTVTTSRARSCLIGSTDKHTRVKARSCFSSEMVSQVRPVLSFLTSPIFTHTHPSLSSLPFPLLSDLSAARHADVLFVKVTGIDEKDNLKTHCDKAGIPYIPFLDFHIAKAIVGQIVRGEKTKDDFLVKPVGSTN
jgi:hypothetical protein